MAASIFPFPGASSSPTKFPTGQSSSDVADTRKDEFERVLAQETGSDEPSARATDQGNSPTTSDGGDKTDGKQASTPNASDDTTEADFAPIDGIPLLAATDQPSAIAIPNPQTQTNEGSQPVANLATDGPSLIKPAGPLTDIAFPAGPDVSTSNPRTDAGPTLANVVSLNSARAVTTGQGGPDVAVTADVPSPSPEDIAVANRTNQVISVDRQTLAERSTPQLAIVTGAAVKEQPQPTANIAAQPTVSDKQPSATATATGQLVIPAKPLQSPTTPTQLPSGPVVLDGADPKQPQPPTAPSPTPSSPAPSSAADRSTSPATGSNASAASATTNGVSVAAAGPTTTAPVPQAQTSSLLGSANQLVDMVSIDDPGTSLAAPTSLPTSLASDPVLARTISQPGSPAVQQVIEQVIRTFDGRSTKFDIRLDPPELGKVDVKIEVGADNKVHAVFAARDPAALEALMRGAKTLENALTQAGIDLSESGLKFEMKQDGRDAFDRSSQSKDNHGNPNGSRSDTNQDETPERLLRPVASSRLDITA